MEQVDSALRRASLVKQREAGAAMNQMMFGMTQANMIDSFGQPRFGGSSGGGGGGGGGDGGGGGVNSGDSHQGKSEGGIEYHPAGDSTGGLNGARGGGGSGGGGASRRGSVTGPSSSRVDSRDASPNFSGAPNSPALATRRTSMTIADPLQMVRMLDRTYVQVVCL